MVIVFGAGAAQTWGLLGGNEAGDDDKTHGEGRGYETGGAMANGRRLGARDGRGGNRAGRWAGPAQSQTQTGDGDLCPRTKIALRPFTPGATGVPARRERAYGGVHGAHNEPTHEAGKLAQETQRKVRKESEGVHERPVEKTAVEKAPGGGDEKEGAPEEAVEQVAEGEPDAAGEGPERAADALPEELGGPPEDPGEEVAQDKTEPAGKPPEGTAEPAPEQVPDEGECLAELEAGPTQRPPHLPEGPEEEVHYNQEKPRQPFTHYVDSVAWQWNMSTSVDST